MGDSESIIERNSQASRHSSTRRTISLDLISFVLRHEQEVRAMRLSQRQGDEEDSDSAIDCPTQ